METAGRKAVEMNGMSRAERVDLVAAKDGSSDKQGFSKGGPYVHAEMKLKMQSHEMKSCEWAIINQSSYAGRQVGRRTRDARSGGCCYEGALCTSFFQELTTSLPFMYIYSSLCVSHR
jgi:hypothetical protein